MEFNQEQPRDNLSSFQSLSWVKVMGLAVLVALVLSGVFVGGYQLGIRNTHVLEPSLPQPKHISPKATKQLLGPAGSNLSSSPILLPSPTPTPNPTTGWKTFSSSSFAIDYPLNMSLYGPTTPGFVSSCPGGITISTLSNLPALAPGHAPQQAIIITVCYFHTEMPPSFPYEDGVAKNNTVSAYTIDGYTGIQGEQVGEVPGHHVLLRDPKGGYADFFLENGTGTQTFDQILSTLRFLH